jgi:hypothetical protein
MPADVPAIPWDEIEQEIDARDCWRRRLADFRADAAVGLRDAGGVKGGGMGRGLLVRCSRANRDRCATLLFFESQWGYRTDYEFLIGPACWVLETELDRLLAAPALGALDALIESLARAGDDAFHAENLRKWHRSKVTTVGVECTVLLALRRGCEQGVPAVLDFLGRHFRPGYAELLRDKRLGTALSRLRDKYRNKVCHGVGRFDARDYEEFVRLMVGARGFGTWDEQGPTPPAPDASAAVLHHHLEQTLHAPEDADEPPDPATARLLALRTPAESSLGVRLHVVRAADPAGLREVVVTPAAPPGPFRLGDKVRFEFEAGEPCHLALIDVGTAGSVSVIWPNHWQRQARVEGGRTYSLPRATLPEFEYQLAGIPGTERIKAVVTRQPLPVPLLPDEGAAFRRLTPRELDDIADALGRCAPAEWGVGGCEFRIGGG